ncbi:MAG: hypothetical protein HY561_10680 [Gemmatimonadetes bacterium]|nr:hypothetical protein [Gemmatimonadota bacterium]
MFYLVGAIAALGLGIYIGLGMPGLPGPHDRVLPPGRARRPRRRHTPLDWLRPPRR